MVNGVERPIDFMSRTLVNAERRWTAIEKECYALHMTFKKFEYLLRDVPFTLYTDHANLVYLNVPPSSKVLRWKIAMQEYNFRLFHIPGEKECSNRWVFPFNGGNIGSIIRCFEYYRGTIYFRRI